MADKGRWSGRITEVLKNGKLRKEQLLIPFLAGILLLVIALPVGKEKNADGEQAESESMGKETSAQVMTEKEYISYMEKHLEGILSQMEGVGEVTVMLTLSASSEKVVEKDIEKGEKSVTETTVYEGDENPTPYVSKEITPKVEGVLVVAEGGDRAVTAKNITEAVQALFGIDTHKIRIVKKQ